MKKALATILALAPLAGVTQAAVSVTNGAFNITEPGTGGAVVGAWGAGGGTATFAPWLIAHGSNLAIPTGGGGTVVWPSTNVTTAVDMLGWIVEVGKADILNNGPGGSTSLNLFGAWGGDGRMASDGSVGTVEAGEIYTLSVVTNGIGDPSLLFGLRANGTFVAPSSQVDYSGTGFQTISRTYNAGSLPLGADLTIVFGTPDGNPSEFGGRMIFDDMALDVIPEPSSALLLSLGGLALMRRRRK